MPSGTLKIWCNSFFSDPDKAFLLQGLEGHELVFAENPAASVLATAPSDPGLLSADIAFGQPDPRDLLHCQKLKWLQITSAGYTRYDTGEFRSAVEQRGMLVSNSSAVFEQACAEHVLSFILAQARLLPMALECSDSPGGSSSWNAVRGGARLLSGQTVLILGYGAIAEKLQPVLAALQMRAIGVRRKPTGKEKTTTVAFDHVDRLWKEADHVINILPEAPGTRHYINAERLARMKPGVIFYNIGRGATVNQEDLAGALQSGQVAGAWLDVTDPEPLPADHFLRKTPRCHITPHTAGGHEEESRHLITHFLDNFNRFLEGKELINRIMRPL